MPSRKRHLLSHMVKRSTRLLFLESRRIYNTISKSEWDLISLVVDMTAANSAQRLQIFSSVYSSLVIVDFWSLCPCLSWPV